MKKIKILFVLLLFQLTVSLTAQSTELPLYRGDRSVTNAYYKDLDNDLGKFAGTWRCVRNDTILIVKLRKKEMHHSTITKSYYMDFSWISNQGW